ncbi:MAG: FHA domain-containing protein [Anaerolineae bacterium]|nr:FHA domain-containing protein [Anaerolineae bacterium]
MANPDHLEIISINGEVTFYVLDPSKGLTNIGSDPENDVVIADERVAPFQAVLDHRQKPYRLVLLTHEGRPLLAGNVLPPDKSVELHNWDQLEFGRYTLVLVENQPGTGGNKQSQTSLNAAGYAQPVIPATIEPPISRPESFSGFEQDWYQPPEPPTGGILRSRPGVGMVPTPFPDHEDDAIYVQLSEREWTVNLEQNETAIYELEITNRGNRVAAFNIFIHGLDQNWLQITPPQINLRERQSGHVQIAVTPPKAPTSYAGPHYFAVMVSSHNYNNRFSQLGAMLEILPYYHFTIDELSPKVRTISWFKQSGETSLVVTNLGNSETAYQLEGGDRENSCNYEFRIPGESVTLANQASLHLLPVGRRDDAIDPDIQLEPHRTIVPITVIPNSRPLFLRRRLHHYEIKVIPAEGQQSPKSQLGELRQRPLFGIIPVLLMTLLLLFLCGSSVWLLFGPRIYTFTVDGSIQTKTINSGEEIALGWEASPFANLRITTNTGSDIGRLDDNIGERTDKPLQSTVYTLEANNILSPLFFFLGDWMTAERRVRVVPVEPSIQEFTINPEHIVLDEVAVLSWKVENADSVLLTRGNQSPETIPTEQYQHEELVTPQQNTTYNLQASNVHGQSSQNVEIVVVTPTSTPVPTPDVLAFTANPFTINEGSESILTWRVLGVQEVTIQGVQGANTFPADYSVSVRPTGSTDYILSVPGVPPRPARVNVIAATTTPSPTPVPEAPIIDFFTASVTDIVEGDNEEITLSWSVIGETTNIEISGPDIGVVSGLPAQGSLPTSADKATIFILTAYNGDLKVSATQQINAEQPTPEPTPLPPKPKITVFVVVDNNTSDIIKPISQNGNKKVVEIEENTDIRFEWSIENDPKTVTFNNKPVSNGSFGSTENPEPARPGVKTLTASNDGGSDSASIEIKTLPEEPPPAPSNFSVCYDDGGSGGTPLYQFRWRYLLTDLPDLVESGSFSVFRSDQSVAVSQVSLEENQQNYCTVETLTSGDPNNNVNVGNIYYVVGNYIDSSGDLRTTDASEQSFAPPFETCTIPCSP